MNRQRPTISTPGISISTMKAVIWFFVLPPTIFGGVLAITTSTPALIKLVHQSFSPLRIKYFKLLEEGVALVSIFGALFGERQNSAEVQTAHENAFAKTAFLAGRVTRRFGESQRGALARRHFGSVDADVGFFSPGGGVFGR